MNEYAATDKPRYESSFRYHCFSYTLFLKLDLILIQLLHHFFSLFASVAPPVVSALPHWSLTLFAIRPISVTDSSERTGFVYSVSLLTYAQTLRGGLVSILLDRLQQLSRECSGARQRLLRFLCTLLLQVAERMSPFSARIQKRTKKRLVDSPRESHLESARIDCAHTYCNYVTHFNPSFSIITLLDEAAI